jgi:hypothetical protein
MMKTNPFLLVCLSLMRVDEFAEGRSGCRVLLPGFNADEENPMMRAYQR